MQDIIQFFLRHWELSLLFVVLFIMVILYEWRTRLSEPRRLSPQQTVALMNHEGAVIVDVRDRSVFKEGHIIGAIQISPDRFEGDLKKILQHKKNPVIVVCGTGFQQSAKIAEKLTQEEFMEVKILDGGINAWKAANLPLEKG